MVLSNNTNDMRSVTFC